jgi:hypothetical protein
MKDVCPPDSNAYATNGSPPIVGGTTIRVLVQLLVTSSFV